MDSIDITNELIGDTHLEFEDSTNEEETPGGVQLTPEEEAILAQALEDEHHEIPENSATISVDETTSRFSGAIWYEQIQKQIVTLAGVGGIGRFGNLVKNNFP